MHDILHLVAKTHNSNGLQDFKMQWFTKFLK